MSSELKIGWGKADVTPKGPCMLAGQMGNHRVKVQNLQVVKIIAEKNLMLVKGSVPGPKGSIVKLERWS